MIMPPATVLIAVLFTSFSAATGTLGSFQATEESLRRAIIEGDIGGVGEFVSRKGIPCDDSVIPRQTVLRDLEDQGSDLSKKLFGGGGLSSRLQDVEGSGVKYREPFDTPDFRCALYGDGAEICMRREPQGWFLSDSLYQCT